MMREEKTDMEKASAAGEVLTRRQQGILWGLGVVLLGFMVVGYLKAPVRWGEGITVKHGERMVGKVNPNVADVRELASLPRVGEKLAGAIVAYRNLHGGEGVGEKVRVFTRGEDLEKVPGMSAKVVEEMGPWLDFGEQ